MKLINNNLDANNLILSLPIDSIKLRVKEKKIFKPSLNSEDYITAILPVISNDCYSKTMQNYRLFIDNYNAKVIEENLKIDAYNALVDENCKNLTIIQTTFKNVFLNKHGKFTKKYCSKTENIIKKFETNLTSRHYNALVDEFCENQGFILHKQKIQPVKYATELIFQQILHAYSVQLSKRNAIRIKFSIAINSPLPPVEVNSLQITNFEREGVKSIKTSKRTILNHRNRLQEAGILIDYEYKGFYQGVNLQINPEILVINDLKKGVYAKTDNQGVKEEKRKNLAEFYDTTGTNKDKNEIKENGQADSLIRSSLSLTPFNLSFYKSTVCKVEKISPRAAGVPEKKENKLSNELLNTIVHPQQLAEELSSGVYWNFEPMDLRILTKEAYHGSMTKEEFREFAIQYFAKYSSKIWKGKDVYTGNWKNALNEMYKFWFLALGKTAFNKHIIVEMLQEYTWRINTARKWFVSKNFNALYPKDYFDRTRTLKKDVGFAFTANSWKKHLEYEKEREIEQSKIVKKSEIRKNKINESEKIENKIRLYLKDKLTIDALYNFVENNHPNYSNNIASMVMNIQSQLNKK